MTIKNVSAGMAFIAGIALFVAGCAATSTNPTATQTATSYECEAGDSAWECRAKESDASIRPTLASNAAKSLNETDRKASATSSNQSQATTAVVETKSTANSAKRNRRGFLGIRLRGRGEDQVAAATQKAVSTGVPTKTKLSRTESPALVSTPHDAPSATTARQALQKTRLSQTTKKTPAMVPPNPNLVASTPEVVRPSSNSTSETDTVTYAQTAPNPISNSSSGDGLGRDYDYAVQLGAFANYNRSSAFINSLPSLDLIQIKTASGGKTYYIVIAGTFENKQLATVQSEMLASTYGLNDSYIRTVKSIRNVQIN